MNSKVYNEKEAGITIVEVIVSLTLMITFLVSASMALVYSQRQAMVYTFNSEAQRILQSHAERMLQFPLSQFTNGIYTNYNFSGLRTTSLANQQAQDALTNKVMRTYYTRDNQGWKSNVAASIVAYETEIRVSTQGVSRVAELKTYWRFMGRPYTNELLVVRGNDK